MPKTRRVHARVRWDETGCGLGMNLAPVASRVSPRRASYFFLRRQKKVTKKKASHVRALRVPCATRSVRGTCKLASLELSTPLNRLRRFPLQGTTPAARQSRLRGVPGRGCASRTSPRLLVRCAHFAGGMKAGGAGRWVVDFRVKDGLRMVYPKPDKPEPKRQNEPFGHTHFF